MSDPNPPSQAEAIGQRWIEDSSLEKWYPFTAAQLIVLQNRNAKLTAACELILLFHGGHTWSMEVRKQWDDRINALLEPTPTSTEATTKNLCNAVRAALKT